MHRRVEQLVAAAMVERQPSDEPVALVEARTIARAAGPRIAAARWLIIAPLGRPVVPLVNSTL